MSNQKRKQQPKQAPEAKTEVKSVEQPATKDSGTEIPPTVVNTAKQDAVNNDAAPSASTSIVYTQYRDAYKLKVGQLEKLMGPGLKFDKKLGMNLQKSHIELLSKFITSVPPEEVRKAFGFILDTQNASPFFTPSCAFKAIVAQNAARQTIPAWYISVASLFLDTANPENRFSVVGKTVDLDKIPDGIPAAFESRLREFYDR